MLWRGNCGGDNFAEQSQPIKNGSLEEGNIVFSPALLSNTQILVEPPDMSNSAVFMTIDHGASRMPAREMPLQQNNTFETDPTRTLHGSFFNVELLTSQIRWNDRHLSSENVVQSCSQNEFEGDSISDAYSKGLLNNLTQALGSSGVDLSQASISVQFDIRKGTTTGLTSTSFGIKEQYFLSHGNQGIRNRDDVYDQLTKRPRTE